MEPLGTNWFDPAVLDTNVLAPSRLRDVILTLAAAGCFRPLWSVRIVEELERTLLGPRFGYDDQRLQSLIGTMEKEFGGAWIPVEPAIEATVMLPDRDDRHLVAVAVTARASIIVTFNTRHFPPDQLGDIRAIRPDQFLSGLLVADQDRVINALRQRSATFQRPARTVIEMIEGIRMHAPTFATNALASLQ